MNYTLHQLQIFLEVSKIKSITKAAEKLNMTQPALSIQLKNFQNQFKIPLTEVIGRKVYITEFGESIAELAENVLREAKEIDFKTRIYEGAIAGKLNISAASTGKYVAPFILSGFINSNPGIDLVLDVTNKTQVIDSLKNNEIDFALVSVLPDGFDIEEEYLIENKLVMVGNTPIFDQSRPYIYREPGSATRAAMDNYLSSNKQRKRLELTSNEAVKQAVIAGLGYSILPLIGITNELKNGELHIIDLPGLPIVTNWRIIWLRKKKLSPAANAFLNFLRQNKSSIIKQHFSKI